MEVAGREPWPERVKTISLWQPWASLIALSLKRVETRPWQPKPWIFAAPHHGRIAIHATRTWVPKGLEVVSADPFLSDLAAAGYGDPLLELPLGAVIAVARIVAVHATDEADWVASLSAKEIQYGNYAPHRLAWELADVVPLPQPAPILGSRMTWNWEPSSATRQWLDKHAAATPPVRRR